MEPEQRICNRERSKKVTIGSWVKVMGYGSCKVLAVLKTDLTKKVTEYEVEVMDRDGMALITMFDEYGQEII
jgi:hypothetical protein